jgi:hypothetical protein
MIINHSKFLSFVGNYKIIDDICGWDWCGGTHHCASFATQRCYLAAINNGLNQIYRKKLSLKNPFLVFIAGLLAIWLVFKVLKVIISIGWIIVLAFVILFIINPRFRTIVQHFFANIFKS